jgi:hypothetical protein
MVPTGGAAEANETGRFTNEKRVSQRYRLTLMKNGRGDRIRTYDPLVPNQMRYQAALHPDKALFYRLNPRIKVCAFK